MIIKSTHGGKRANSGRKKQAPPNATRHFILVTPEELILVKEYIQQLRATAK